MSAATATDGPAIRVVGLEKSYKDLQALQGVDLEIPPGSIVALLGSNGAGKTALVKILATLLRADAGMATVAGFDVASQATRVRESISLTGQFAAVDGILTGREILELVAKLRRVADPRAVADDLLARFSLSEAGGRQVAGYSGGMRRRLDIAMSLIGDPPVIFSTSRRPGSIPRPASRSGMRSRPLPTAARRCCSQRNISKRPSSPLTASRFCTRDGSSWTAPSRS